MRIIILLLIAFTSAITATAQNVAELERRNGFKDLKLGMHIDSVKGEKNSRKILKSRTSLTQSSMLSSIWTMNESVRCQ